jgi:hypothetical protein
MVVLARAAVRQPPHRVFAVDPNSKAPPRMPMFWDSMCLFPSRQSHHTLCLVQRRGCSASQERIRREANPMRCAFPAGESLSCLRQLSRGAWVISQVLLQTSVASTRQGSNRDTLEGEARAKRSWLPIPPAAGRVGDARFLPFRAVESVPKAWGPQNPASILVGLRCHGAR